MDKNSIKNCIVNANDLEQKAVEVPEWTCTVWMRVLPGFERDRWQNDAARRIDPKTDQVKNAEDLMALLVVRCMVDENGERIFDDMEAKELNKRSAKVINRLFEIAAAMNGITRDAVDELAKNSSGVPSGNSGSSSLAPSGLRSANSSSGWTRENSASGLPTTST